LFQKSEQISRQGEQLRRMERREFEQKLEEENARLRLSEERFARFMQHLPGLAWIKDSQGRYVFANDAAVSAFRTSGTEALYGKTDDEVFPPETAAQFKANDQQALSSSGVQVIETLVHEDGIRHHSLVSKFPIPGPDGTGTLVGGMAIDITEHQRTQEVLEESEERFRQLAENINEVFWMSDPQKSQVLYVSPTYEQVWGRSCRSLYEQPRSFLDAIHPDDREHVLAASLERQRRGEPSDVEYRIVRPDGTVRAWIG
jgi:PAS domain S-box-containing protein